MMMMMMMMIVVQNPLCCNTANFETLIVSTTPDISQSAGAVEYTDCIPAEGQDLNPKE